MQIISAYVIKQVASNGDKDEYVGEILNLFHEAKRRNDLSYIGRNFYMRRYDEEEYRETSTDRYGTSGRRELVKSNPNVSNGLLPGVGISYYDAAYYCRYKRDIYYNSNEWLIENGVWDATKNGSNVYYMYPSWMVKDIVKSYQEETESEWYILNEYQGGARTGHDDDRIFDNVNNHICCEGAAETTEIAWHDPIRDADITVQINKATISTNVPHFLFAEHAIQHVINLMAYFSNTLPEADFDNFIKTNVILP